MCISICNATFNLYSFKIFTPFREKYILQQLRWKHKRNSDYNYVITQDPRSVQNFMIYVLDEGASALNSFHVKYEHEIYTIYVSNKYDTILLTKYCKSLCPFYIN